MRHTSSRRLEDELDAWVLQEFEAIIERREPSNRCVTDETRSEHPLHVVDEEDQRGAFAEPRGPAENNAPPFGKDESAFIEQTVEWLRGRGNADILLEEVWRLSVADQAEERRGSEPKASDDPPPEEPEPAPDEQAGSPDPEGR
jgi:hypothetical protein